jgi:hypothetical protein
MEHEATVVTLRNVSGSRAVHKRNLLISKPRQPFDYRQASAAAYLRGVSAMGDLLPDFLVGE